ncbi:glycosyltransferase family 9 protein [Flavobacterium columnare]|uniref:Glycosyltransferase family 9 protein n=1 Tax=Flavobacterium columnare TaxID=996 RepID=A0AAI8CHN3_9FLAO|nr:glycosyltransferase family 9 protein [Flavobacterium columnare]AMO20376.1 glycosyltransferase family 9 protein [Flavobacterium columnare]AUX18337.1 heptosyltransferase [Flavobacterium columnare]QOG57422.1 glycosyltransferase family 9 protein [Flavobacterium columnare]QOG60146.1 glycosyltransferase family 9 protein [Flavobacterium columnare]QOG62866.1 glycosyltransferase family 9 protein [Flavobacterium columnare]
MKHLLVIRLSAMGDVAMTVPVLRALSLKHPELKITVVSRPFFQPFFNGLENVSFFPVDLNKKHKGMIGLVRLYNDLKKLNIDAVADFHNVLRSKVIRGLFAVNGKKVAFTDKERKDNKALTRSKNKVFAPVKSMFERHKDTLVRLGFSFDLLNSEFPDKALLSDQILGITGNKMNKWIGIAPFAQYDSKIYPLDLMQKVVDGLAKETIKIFLFGGGKKEIEKLYQLKKEHPNVQVVAGKIKLQEELDLISNLDLMLSMDSGNGHIASMLGVNVITLWGATHPYSGFSPFNQPLENCLTADREKYPMLPTSVYGNKEVEGYEDVMRTIEPEIIINKIKKDLDL